MKFTRLPLEIQNIPVRIFAFIILFTSIAVAIASVILTQWLKLQPCPLCIFQRFLYLVICAPALIFLIFPQRIITILSSLLIVIVSMIGMITAIYQSWMQFYPEVATGCGGSQSNLIEQFVDYLSTFSDFFLATGSCSSKEWVFLGLSIANWSVFVYLFLLLIAGLAIKRIK